MKMKWSHFRKTAGLLIDLAILLFIFVIIVRDLGRIKISPLASITDIALFSLIAVMIASRHYSRLSFITKFPYLLFVMMMGLILMTVGISSRISIESSYLHVIMITFIFIIGMLLGELFYLNKVKSSV